MGTRREQRDRVECSDWTGFVRSRDRHRWSPVNGLAADSEWLPAGRDQVRFRTSAEEHVGDLCARADQVLAVVQDDQDVLWRKRLGQGLQRGPPATSDGDMQSIANGSSDAILVRNRS